MNEEPIWFKVTCDIIAALGGLAAIISIWDKITAGSITLVSFYGAVIRSPRGVKIFAGVRAILAIFFYCYACHELAFREFRSADIDTFGKLWMISICAAVFVSMSVILLYDALKVIRSSIIEVEGADQASLENAISSKRVSYGGGVYGKIWENKKTGKWGALLIKAR